MESASCRILSLKRYPGEVCEPLTRSDIHLSINGKAHNFSLHKRPGIDYPRALVDDLSVTQYVLSSIGCRGEYDWISYRLNKDVAEKLDDLCNSLFHKKMKSDFGLARYCLFYGPVLSTMKIPGFVLSDWLSHKQCMVKYSELKTALCKDYSSESTTLYTTILPKIRSSIDDMFG